MIIGITGTLGAGKGTVVEYLKTKGFEHFWARAFFKEEIERRGLPVNRDTMTEVANDMREKHGPGFFAKHAVEYAEKHGGNIVAESIRSVGEGEYLKSHGAVLWAIDADPHTRYERVILRSSETDKVSFEKFLADEQREWDNQDPTKQNLKAVIAMADHVFYNNGTPEELFKQVEETLAKLKQ